MEKKNDPGEQVLLEWEKKGLTVNYLYDALVQIKCQVIADIL